MNIANDICLRLQNNLTALNGTLNFSINDYALGCNGSGDMSPAGDHFLICPLTSTKPSAVTLPAIFNPLAITVPRCFDANMVTSQCKKEPNVWPVSQASPLLSACPTNRKLSKEGLDLGWQAAQ